MLTIDGIDDLKAKVGEELGVSDWYEVTQERIDAFADATGDHQWIHVDPEKAKDTPFGGTIAHGLFTLSLGPQLGGEIFTMSGIAFALNYGFGKVRFPAPVPVGSKLRMRATLTSRRGRRGRRAVHGHPDLRDRGRREAGLRGRGARAGLPGLSGSARHRVCSRAPMGSPTAPAIRSGRLGGPLRCGRPTPARDPTR